MSMNRREFIRHIGIGIAAGAAVPFIPSLLPDDNFFLRALKIEVDETLEYLNRVMGLEYRRELYPHEISFVYTPVRGVKGYS